MGRNVPSSYLLTSDLCFYCNSIPVSSDALHSSDIPLQNQTMCNHGPWKCSYQNLKPESLQWHFFWSHKYDTQVKIIDAQNYMSNDVKTFSHWRPWTKVFFVNSSYSNNKFKTNKSWWRILNNNQGFTASNFKFLAVGTYTLFTCILISLAWFWR